MKKFMQLGYIILFLLFCCIPVFTMPFFGEETDMEKRQLQERPVLWDEKGINLQFTRQFENWIGDHFTLRSGLVTGWSKLKEQCFATSAQEKVIVGRQDWLFFSETLEDYRAENALTCQEEEDIAKILALMDEYVRKKGGKFLFLAAPNKNSLYPEYMPYYYQQGEGTTPLEQMNKRLEGESFYVNLLSIYESIAISDENNQLFYHKRDTHWNNYGAAVAFENIMDRLGKNHVDWLAMDYHTEQNWYGDLEQMLYPTGGSLDEQVVWDYPTHFSYASSFHSPEDINIATKNSQKEGCLLMFRDSFGNALYPFFAEDYGSAHFSRSFPYRLYLLEEEPCDTVLVELVERNIAMLLENAPVMPAPVREEVNGIEVPKANMFKREYQDMCHVYGTFPDGYSGDILIAVTKGTDTTYYEAFPVLEAELLAEEGKYMGSEEKIRGFSCYLPWEEDADLQLRLFTTN